MYICIYVYITLSQVSSDSDSAASDHYGSLLDRDLSAVHPGLPSNRCL